MTTEKCIELTGHQIKALSDWIGDPDSRVMVGYFEACTEEETGEPMDAGLYAWFAEYPEEGRLYLPEDPEHV